MTKFLIAIFLSFSLISCGQNKKVIDIDKQRIDRVCDSFMQKFVSGKVIYALELLKQNTVMTPSTIDTLQVTITEHMTNLFPAYGKMLSSDFIIEKKIKDFIAKRFYIIKFENYYLKFDFTLYKTTNGWTVTNFKYDEDLVELLY